MITNKDLSIDSKNGQVILNGDKYDLGTQGEIDAAVKDVYSVMGEMGAKNLIPYPYYETTKTAKGVTFTDNGDGTITVSGTASADATFDIRNIWLASDIVELLPNTIYAFSGCPVGGGTSTYSIQFGNEERDMSNKSWYDDIGTGGTLTTTDVKRFVGLRIIIKSGTAFSTPVTFKPMLRLASDTDDTYQPYAMTNKQLTDELDTAREQIANKIKIIPNTGASYTCTSTNLEYTGVSVTCPAGHTYIVRAALSFSNTAPVEILVSKSNTNSNVHNRLAYAESGFVTFLLKGGETAYIWGKWEATGTNSVSYDAVDISN